MKFQILNGQAITLNNLAISHENYALFLIESNNIDSVEFYRNKAVDYYLKALEIHKKTNNSKSESKVYANLSISYRRNKEYKKALELAINSYYISKKINSPSK
jgi:tetratricopeptide (TPR) repeat protein